MDDIQKLVLTVGIIFLSAYAMKISQEAINTMHTMNRQIEMMFVKS